MFPASLAFAHWLIASTPAYTCSVHAVVRFLKGPLSCTERPLRSVPELVQRLIHVVVKLYAGKQKDLGSIPLRLAFLFFESLLFMGVVLRLRA